MLIVCSSIKDAQNLALYINLTNSYYDDLIIDFNVLKEKERCLLVEITSYLPSKITHSMPQLLNEMRTNAGIGDILVYGAVKCWSKNFNVLPIYLFGLKNSPREPSPIEHCKMIAESKELWN